MLKRSKRRRNLCVKMIACGCVCVLGKRRTGTCFVVKYISMATSNLSGECQVSGVFCSGLNGLSSSSKMQSHMYDLQ